MRFTWPPFDEHNEDFAARFAGEDPAPAESEKGPEPDIEPEPSAFEAGVLGALGLAPRSLFHYLFDFGAAHRFDISVLEVRPTRTVRTKYPRVTERVGASPPQYDEG